MSKPRQQYLIIMCAVGLLLFGLGLRLHMLGLPYWYDEANTIYYVSQTYSRMLQFIQSDYSPPFYYLLLRGWVAFFGSSETATGLLSLLFSGLSLAVFYRFVTNLTNRRTAIIASLIFWLNNYMIYYSVETRMYALVVLLSLVSCYCLWKLLQHPTWYYWAGYCLAALAGVYTHNTFFFLLLAQNFVWAFMRWRYRTVNLPLKHWLLGQGALFLGYLYWLPTVWRQITFNTQSPIYWTDYAAAKGMLAMPEILLNSLNNYWFPLANLVIVSLVGYVLSYFIMSKNTIPKVYLTILIVISLGGVYLADILMSKFVIFVYPLFFIVLAIGIEYIPLAFHKKVIVLTFLLFSSGLIHFTSNAGLTKNSPGFMVPSMVEYIESRSNSNNAVIVLNGYPNEVTFDYYYHGKIKTVGAFPRSMIVDNDLAVSQIKYNGQVILNKTNAPEIDRLMLGYHSVWLVLFEDNRLFDPMSVLEHRLNKYCQLQSEHYFPDAVVLVQYTKIVEYSSCDFPRTLHSGSHS